MANMTVENKVFQLPIDIESNGVVKKVIATADTYVDKNIEVTVNTPDASYEVKKGGAVSATVSTTDTTYTSETETPYAITIAADAHADAVQVGVKDAGFAAATDVIDVEAVDAEQNTKTIYVKEGSLSGTGSAGAEGNIDLVKVGAQPESGFYIKASGAGNVEVATAGWVDPEHTTAVSTDGDAFYTIKEAKLSNNETGDFTEVDAPVLTEDGYLFINEGYIAPTKISLATLVPDDANITSENADKVYNTVKAYDKDGKLIVGTMGDAELGAITADDAEANISSVTVAAQEGVFHVTGTGAISGNASVAISKRGLAETTLAQNGVIEGEAALDATIAKVGLAVEMDSDVEVTPVIAKEDATTAKSGDITTTQPSGRYIAISTAAIEASATATPTVATEGYGTADLHDATGATVKAGAAASGTYYVPVNAGSHTAEAGETTIVNASATVATDAEATEGFDGDLVAGILTTAPTSGEYITISADATPVKGSVSGTVTCASTEGYIETSSETASIAGDVEVEVTAAADKYIRVFGGELLEA